MNNKVLKRYAIVGWNGEDYQSVESKTGPFVLADDAAHEIERLDAQIQELKGELHERLEKSHSVWKEHCHELEVELAWWRNLIKDRNIGTDERPSLRAYIEWLEARVRELEGILSSNENWATVAHTIEKQYGLIGQERDRLREQYNKVLVAIDEGLVEDDADLAAASVVEMQATITRLHEVVGDSSEYLCEKCNCVHPSMGTSLLQPCPNCGNMMLPSSRNVREISRLRGLIGALPLSGSVIGVIMKHGDPHWDVVGKNVLMRCWSQTTADALAALLREKQTI